MRILRGLFLIILLSACDRQGDSAAPQPAADLKANLQLAATWSAASSDGQGVEDGWLARFHDAQLNALVDEALAHNSELRQLPPAWTRRAPASRQANADLISAVSAALGAPRPTTAPGPLSSSRLVSPLIGNWMCGAVCAAPIMPLGRMCWQPKQI